MGGRDAKNTYLFIPRARSLLCDSPSSFGQAATYRSFMKRRVRYVTSFPNSCTLKNVFKLSGLNRLIFSNDVNHPNYRETIFLEFPLNRTAANR